MFLFLETSPFIRKKANFALSLTGVKWPAKSGIFRNFACAAPPGEGAGRRWSLRDLFRVKKCPLLPCASRFVELSKGAGYVRKTTLVPESPPWGPPFGGWAGDGAGWGGWGGARARLGVLSFFNLGWSHARHTVGFARSVLA